MELDTALEQIDAELTRLTERFSSPSLQPFDMPQLLTRACTLLDCLDTLRSPAVAERLEHLNSLLREKSRVTLALLLETAVPAPAPQAQPQPAATTNSPVRHERAEEVNLPDADKRAEESNLPVKNERAVPTESAETPKRPTRGRPRKTAVPTESTDLVQRADPIKSPVLTERPEPNPTLFDLGQDIAAFTPPDPRQPYRTITKEISVCDACGQDNLEVTLPAFPLSAVPKQLQVPYVCLNPACKHRGTDLIFVEEIARVRDAAAARAQQAASTKLTEASKCAVTNKTTDTDKRAESTKLPETTERPSAQSSTNSKTQELLDRILKAAPQTVNTDALFNEFLKQVQTWPPQKIIKEYEQMTALKLDANPTPDTLQSCAKVIAGRIAGVTTNTQETLA